MSSISLDYDDDDDIHVLAGARNFNNTSKLASPSVQTQSSASRGVQNKSSTSTSISYTSEELKRFFLKKDENFKVEPGQGRAGQGRVQKRQGRTGQGSKKNR